MRQLRKIKFTKKGLEDLKKELEDLEQDRPDAVKELSRAREMGDLSENGLYTAAKARLRSMDSKILRMKSMIKLADVEEQQEGIVGIGSKVLVKQNGKEIQYEIVGDYEANPLEKKVSANSPIGTALLGKVVGELAIFESPSGKISLEVVKVV